MIDKLLLEKLPLAGIARITGVSNAMVIDLLMSTGCMLLFQKMYKFGLKKGRLTIQCDEIWSFIGNKKNKQWIWFAEQTNASKVCPW